MIPRPPWRGRAAAIIPVLAEAPDPPSPPADRPVRRIPVPFRAVVAAAAERWLGGELVVAEVARRLEACFGAECGAEEEELKAAFAPLAAARPADDEACFRTFRERFVRLLRRANYAPLAHDALEAAARLQAVPGLQVQVDFSAYDRLEVHVRGRGEEVRTVRRWWRPWRTDEVRVATHERVVLLARVAREAGLHLKLFRDIPEDDLEALLPETRFKMRLFDHLKIGGAGSTAIAASIMRYVAVFGTKAAGALALPLVILGSLWYAGRTIWGYFRAKDTYRARLMHELFYQMLDSDLGVITRIVDDAEDEEAKEAFLLWAAAVRLGPCTPAAAAAAVEAHLAEVHGCSVAFDLDDAAAKCARLGLLAPSHDGWLRAVSPGAAAVRLAAAQVRLTTA